MSTPFCTGIDPATGEPVWHRNVVFKTPRREHWPNAALAPDADDELIRKVGDHLRKQVLMAASAPGSPTGKPAPMPPGILYIHGSVHFNGVWLLFNDFAEAIRHFSDRRFAAEFRRLVREEGREPVTLFRDRDYDRTEFANFVCFMRTTFPGSRTAMDQRSSSSGATLHLTLRSTRSPGIGLATRALSKPFMAGGTSRVRLCGLIFPG